MEKDQSELIEYLGQKFDKIDDKLTKIDSQLFGISGDITELKEGKADKDDVNNLMNAIDSYAKKADTYFSEMVALSHKVDRHEKWLMQIAEKVGINLEH